MEFKQLLTVTEELSHAARLVDGAQAEALADEILRAKRVFIAGAGRSGLCARAFVKRLIHLGIAVHFVGDQTTPPIAEGDLLLIGSGSGKTAGLIVIAEKAKKLGARLATVTISPQSPIGAMCDTVLTLPGTTRLLAGEKSAVESAQPMGSLFEQLCFLTYDAIVMILMEKTGQTREDLVRRHGNLE